MSHTLVKEVMPLDNLQLLVTFDNGKVKKYDVAPLLNLWEPFKQLETITGLFNTVRIDMCGHGIVWNDEIDLDSEELWENGKEVK